MYLSFKKNLKSIEFVVAEINSFKVEKNLKNGSIRFSFRDFEIFLITRYKGNLKIPKGKPYAPIFKIFSQLCTN